MTQKKLSKEKETRLLEISLTPVFVAFFIVMISLLYLEVEISLYAIYLLSVLFGGFFVCLALNEVLQKIYGGQFKFKRLFFRWMLIGLFLVPFVGVYFCLLAFLPWSPIFFQFLFSGLIATGIFMLIIYRFRHLFNKLDTGEW
jgi:hypothetical protein